jgi:hypothetical protein
MNKIKHYSFEVEKYKQELKERFSENEILELIALQLNRDCSKSAISIEFPEKIDAKAIQEKLLGIVKSISSEQFEQFAYIIDLPEHTHFQEAYFTGDFELVVDLILLRTIVKVYFRSKYSN